MRMEAFVGSIRLTLQSIILLNFVQGGLNMIINGRRSIISVKQFFITSGCDKSQPFSRSMLLLCEDAIEMNCFHYNETCIYSPD